MKASYEHIQAGSDASFRCFERRDRRFEYEWHYHPQFELTLITAGIGSRHVGDHLDQYTPGDLVLLGPDLPHTWASHEAGRNTGEQAAVVIQFEGDFLGRSFFEAPEMRTVATMLHRAGRGLWFAPRDVEAVRELITAMPTAPVDRRLVMMLDLLRALSHVRRPRPLASTTYAPGLRRNEQQRLGRVCAHLHENYTEPIVQADMARMLRMNPAAFSRFFKRATGRTMTAYVNELRLGHAARLLIETQLSVLEICYASGFNNAANFHRQFVRFKGTSPGKFRKRISQVAAEPVQ